MLFIPLIFQRGSKGRGLKAKIKGKFPVGTAGQTGVSHDPIAIGFHEWPRMNCLAIRPLSGQADYTD